MNLKSAQRRPGMRLQVGVLFLVSLLFLMTAAFSASAAPDAALWPRWTKHDDRSGKSIDHSAWTKFLAAYTRTDSRGVGLVRYGNVATGDRQALDDYIMGLTRLPIGAYARREQLAYWINLYNALTVQLILTRYPVDSIMDIKISPGWFSVGPWGQKLATVEGVRLSLDDIEHRILRPIWKDPRIHYGVNCASVGCPNLRKQAYTAANVDGLLDEGAKDYINNRRGAEFIGTELYVSSIYSWFIDDFGGNYRGVIDHLKRFALPELKGFLGRTDDVSGHRYDWSLNADKMPK